MDKSRLSAGVITVLLGGLVAMDTAEAVHLSRNGIGQALVYPYYTVNAQQQTLLSVVNTGSTPKAVKVRFHEGHNGRAVLEFNLFLSPYDVWTGNVFALADIDVRSDGAAITTTDRSCTAPAFSEAGTMTPSGAAYVAFRDEVYLTPDDGGPYGIERTREGHFEIIAMASLAGTLAAAVKHNASGVPANCMAVRNLTGSEPDLLAPGVAQVPSATPGGLFGSAGIINVQAGTYFAYNADALENFTGRVLFPTTAQVGYPNLGDVNDGTGALALQATALVVTPTGATLSTYPGFDPNSRRIDAVSAVFLADSAYNEFLNAGSVAANTDWVIGFPTKAFYVDELYTSSVSTSAIPPFTRLYDAGACVGFGGRIFDREERTTLNPIFPGVPPPQPPPPTMCRQTNVFSFLDPPAGVTPAISGALKSRLLTNVRTAAVGNVGWMLLNLNPVGEPHALLPATNGNIHRGLPVTGFSATSITNSNATTINGVSTLSNYSSTSMHRSTSRCINGSGACQ